MTLTTLTRRALLLLTTAWLSACALKPADTQPPLAVLAYDAHIADAQGADEIVLQTADAFQPGRQLGLQVEADHPRAHYAAGNSGRHMVVAEHAVDLLRLDAQLVAQTSLRQLLRIHFVILLGHKNVCSNRLSKKRAVGRRRRRRPYRSYC